MGFLSFVWTEEVTRSTKIEDVIIKIKNGMLLIRPVKYYSEEFFTNQEIIFHFLQKEISFSIN